MEIKRIKLKVEYNGTFLSGWNGEEIGLIFIKPTLEQAIYDLFQQKTEVFCAGRTDAGVHATGQICHFDIFNKSLLKIPVKNILLGLNFYLPSFIKIKSATEVDKNFHARFSAKTRSYRYLIFNENGSPVLLRDFCLHEKRKLDIEKMKIAAKFLVIKRDFSFFIPKKYDGLRLRTLDFCHIHLVEIFGNVFIAMDFKAQSFAHHQVRNMVGSIMEVGFSKWTIEEFEKRVNSLDRTLGGPTAMAKGLTLTHVDY